jgi:hypothetical protein
MIMPGNAYVANLAGSSARFLTEAVPKQGQVIWPHIVEPTSLHTPSASRIHKILALTVGDITRNPEVVEMFKHFNECFGICYNGNLGSLHSFYAYLSARPIEELHATLDRAPIEPSARVHGNGYVYGYWFADRPYSLGEWQRVQMTLAKYLREGRHLCQPSLMFPMPGFDELCIERDGTITRVPVECAVFEPKRRYTARQVLKAFKRR